MSQNNNHQHHHLHIDKEHNVAMFPVPTAMRQTGTGKVFIVFGVHIDCGGDEGGVLQMNTTDDVFDLVMHCLDCGMGYHMVITTNDDDLMDFTAWAINILTGEQE